MFCHKVFPKVYSPLDVELEYRLNRDVGGRLN